MQRIIWHWTGGSHNVTSVDKAHYHEIIDGSGVVHKGNNIPEDNLNITDGDYAAHTLNCNTGSIGIAVAAMGGSEERPLKWGPYPLTKVQMDKLLERTKYYCEKYDIPVTRRTVLSHAEVQPTLGIKQRGKWDFTVLPGMDSVADPVVVGDKLRYQLSSKIGPVPVDKPEPVKRETFWEALMRIFSWKK
jgi:hypothetical protein